MAHTSSSPVRKKSVSRVKAAPLKGERSDIRLTSDTKTLIQQAAGLMGMTVTAFVVNHSYEAAKRIIFEHNAIMLTAKGQRDLLEMLQNPPPPNEALKAVLAGTSSETF
jgi:uncharacterized protein (DUF1778 family)